MRGTLAQPMLDPLLDDLPEQWGVESHSMAESSEELYCAAPPDTRGTSPQAPIVSGVAGAAFFACALFPPPPGARLSGLARTLARWPRRLGVSRAAFSQRL